MTAPLPERCETLVIGGGFYGCSIALERRRSGDRHVIVMESGDGLLTRSSYANQARVHGGYHYPRSLLTGIRSRVNFSRFTSDYKECIAPPFDKYYAIARTGSNVSAAQFVQFCERIEAPIEAAGRDVRDLFDPERIESVFRVRETAFDAVALRRRVAEDLARAEVPVFARTEATRLSPTDSGGIAVDWRAGDARGRVEADRVFNCTYSRCNRLLADSGLPLIPLKHELTEIALVQPPPLLADLGVTVMCGPFFSMMPFPPRPGLHSLSHVRYTPFFEWYDAPETRYRDPDEVLASAPRRSRCLHMMKDAERYLPSVAGCRHVDSLWEVKTVLPRSEVDDSRPILLRRDHGLPNLSCVMGSKIDNVYDVLDCLEAVPV